MDMIEELRSDIERSAKTAATVADFFEPHAKSQHIDPQFVNQQLAKLAQGQATIFAHMLTICSLMACLRDGVGTDNPG